MNDDRPNLGQLEVTNALGMRLLLPVASVEDAFKRMRYMGARGWSTGPVPAGGFVLPYAMAETFDWSLIGARAFEHTVDGETMRCVEHRGMIYTRRDYAAVTKGKKMPAKVKYSRGAKPTDEPHLREGGTGESAGYVTLIQFVGGGNAIPEFERHGARRPLGAVAAG
jgi:hypothetical protein